MPNSLRRGETKAVEVTGSGLSPITVQSSVQGLSLSHLRSDGSHVNFDLSAAADAPLGPQLISFSNAAGSAGASVTIYPTLPTFAVSPIPLAIPPDNTARQFTVQLSHADAFDHSFALSVGDATVIRVSPATLTITAGQTQASQVRRFRPMLYHFATNAN